MRWRHFLLIAHILQMSELIKLVTTAMNKELKHEASASSGSYGLSKDLVGSSSEFNGYCRQPGMKCNNPIGGICQRPTPNSELVCDCPSSHTKVTNGKRKAGGFICQIKLLSILCSRDHDFACLLVKDSVCNPAGGYCICPIGYVYVAHRHQCKRRYTGNHAYCEFCRKELGSCFIEDDLHMSDGPEIEIKRGLPGRSTSIFRLSCACPSDKGVPRSTLASWKSPVCSTRLRDLEEECNDHKLQCRSKRAECRQPRDQETDWRRCLCPQRHVAVYQQWLGYYECFEEMDHNSIGCEQCARSQPFGLCYSTDNGTSGSGCVCPKRMSTPVGSSEYCSKHHVTITCGGGAMAVQFDPNYPEDPYSTLLNRLQSNLAIAFILGADAHQEDSLCELKPYGHLYQITLNTTDDNVCGRRTIRVTPLDSDRFRYEARLLVLYNRNFYTYPDIRLSLYCTTTNHPLRHKSDGFIKNLQIKHGKQLPPASRIELSLQVMDEHNRIVREIVEDELVRLDLVLNDKTESYTMLMVQQCLVSNRSQSQSSAYYGSISSGTTHFAATQIIQCGGLSLSDKNRLPVGASGFLYGFQPIDGIDGNRNHYQTRMFKAFRVGSSPSVYIVCSVRLCAPQESRFCLESSCLEKNKRSPDDGTKIVEKEVHFVVNKKQSSIRQHSVTYCASYSICLTTGQIVVIILVLMIILALACGLAIIVYRRKNFYSPSHQLEQFHLNDDSLSPTIEIRNHQLKHPQRCVAQPIPINLGISSDGSIVGCGVDTRVGNIRKQYHGSFLTTTGTIDSFKGNPECSSLMDKLFVHHCTAADQSDQAKNRCDESLCNRPDVCTCESTISHSYSVISSQV